MKVNVPVIAVTPNITDQATISIPIKLAANVNIKRTSMIPLYFRKMVRERPSKNISPTNEKNIFRKFREAVITALNCYFDITTSLPRGRISADLLGNFQNIFEFSQDIYSSVRAKYLPADRAGSGQ